MSKTKSVKGELFKELSKDKSVVLGLDAKVPYFVNSGHYGLNMVLSGRWLGGWPAGTVCELFGDPSSGKSLLVSRQMVSFQKKEIYVNEGCESDVNLTDTFVLLDDTEGAYQEKFCEMQGMDINDVIKLHKKSPTVEEHFTQMEDKILKIRKLTSNSPIGVFCDSISQLSTDHEMKEKMEKVDMGKAKLVHAAMRIYSDLIHSNMVMYLACSHVTESMNMYGPKRAIKGGKGLAFQSTVRVDLRYLSRFVRNQMETDEAGDRGETYGVKIIAEAVKNRMAPPFMFTVIDVFFDKGIDPYSGLFDYFMRKGRVTAVEKTVKKEEPEEKKDKKKKRKINKNALYLLDNNIEFKRDEFTKLVISEDLLGIKAEGHEYMPTLDAGDMEEEEIEQEEEMIPAPPPLPVPKREPLEA